MFVSHDNHGSCAVERLLRLQFYKLKLGDFQQTKTEKWAEMFDGSGTGGRMDTRLAFMRLVLP